MNHAYQFVLASKSPRRKELLARLCPSFSIIPAVGEEVQVGTTCEEIVMHLAAHKAQEVYQRLTAEGTHEDDSQYFVIGADTIVVHEGQILGKPEDEADAWRMLRQLSGRTHQVYTGVSFCYDGNLACEAEKVQPQVHTFFERTAVTFAELTDGEIRRYIESGDAFDKAGAYGIQGAFSVYVTGICGDYNTVVGLPVARMYQELRNLQIA